MGLEMDENGMNASHAPEFAADRRARLRQARGLYGMLNAAAGERDGDILARLDVLIQAEAPVIQLRAKRMEAGPLIALAKRCAARCRDSGALFFVNDRVDAALAAGADGVHLGQEDLPLEMARRIAPDLLIGVSTHNAAQFRAALASPGRPDYLALGPVFPTATKETPDPVIGVEMLAELSWGQTIPIVAIGGVTPDNAASCFRAGAVMVAVIAGVFQAASPLAAARSIMEASWLNR
ncbi:MAG: Thiamine-phosphate synthase [Myxococcota bacterium]|nr:Thiamine-phosphate synthase [Myxococcota bacterium]